MRSRLSHGSGSRHSRRVLLPQLKGAHRCAIFFHVMNGEAVIDEVGSEHPDLDAMRQEAMVSAGQMLSTGDQDWVGEAWQRIVTDHSGRIVFGVWLTDRHGL